MGTLLQDLKYGLRQLARNPGFTAAAVLTLALGIGANTAIFSAVNALFLRDLPVRDPGQLVSLGFTHKKDVGLSLYSYPDFHDVQLQAGRWADLFAYRWGFDGLSDGGRAEQVLANYITGDYFNALGVRPAIGRLILPSEGRVPGSDPVIVLGYSYWMRRFGGDPSIIGRQVRVDGHPITVVGVAQKGFHGTLREVDVQAYLPANMTDIEGFTGMLTDRNARAFFVLGRMRPGVSLSQARGPMHAVAAGLSRQYPDTDLGADIWVLPQREAAINPLAKPGDYQHQLMAVGLFLGLAILVLLLASFNVANLLLVRATTRGHEMAVRAALGASRRRLLRQVLTESALLAILGCGAGVVVGSWGTTLLSSVHFTLALPVHLRFGFDWRVFAYAVGVAMLAGMVVGLVPAFQAARSNPGDALHEGGRTIAAGRHWLRSLLVAAQVGGSVILLVVAGLFMRSLKAAQEMDLGFKPSHVLNLTMDPHQAGYSQEQGLVFYKSLLTRVRALPGVQSAGLAFQFPTSEFSDYSPVYVEGHESLPGEAAPTISENHVSPEYFKTMGIPLLSGREFRDTDDAKAPNVAIISQTMARELWPNQDALGRKFRMYSQSESPIKVIGIARDCKYQNLLASAEPYFYVPLAQKYISIETLQVRTEAAPESMIGEVEEQIHALAPGLPVTQAQTMEQALNSGFGGFYTFHLAAWLAGALGLLGLLLAVIGVYGVISYSTRRQTHEIGIRMALGALPGDISRVVLGQGFVMIGAGGLIGLIGSLAATRLMAGFLYGVRSYDPLTYLGVILLIAVVTMIACYIPARRAAKVDPMVALRYE